MRANFALFQMKLPWVSLACAFDEVGALWKNK